MFKKLRNKLILINLGVTSVVIIIVFTMIYVVSRRTAENRPLDFQNMPEVEIEDDDDTEEWRKIITFSIREEKKTAAEQLLITLIISGIAIEVVVAFISYFLAEEAIKPVKETYDAQKVFIANASHEIKTPIAAISANLEAADITGNKWIDNVEKETTKLAKLNNELLTLARTDLVTEAKVELVDLKTLTLKILDGFEPRLVNKKLTRTLCLNKKVKLNAADFEQILSILIDNAIKYSDKNIRVKLSEHILTVENDGTAIAPEKLPHIFDRFYQADKSTEGVGLGLAIAQSVANRNHWKLEVSSKSAESKNSATSKNSTVFKLNF